MTEDKFNIELRPQLGEKSAERSFSFMLDTSFFSIIACQRWPVGIIVARQLISRLQADGIH
jgi:hypothetical protein